MPRGKSEPLSRTHPDIAKEWNYRRNDDLSPDNVISTDSKKVFWQCHVYKAHVWAAPICVRTEPGQIGCPYCWSKSKGENRSLADLEPETAALWHPSKNEPLTPFDVNTNSKKLAWWQCQLDPTHVWQAAICVVNIAVKEGRSGRGCPKCNKFPAKEKWNTSLEEAFPQLAKEWHKTKNIGLSPKDLSPGSSEIVWWKCGKSLKHDFTMSVNARVAKRQGCPYCAGRRVLANDNSLAATNPSLAKQWHKTLNKGLKPEDVTIASARKVFWQCPREKDHIWEAKVFSRGIDSAGCPFCAGHKATTSNCLATLRPDLAEEWHPTLNADLTPEKVTIGSDKRVWWRCRNNSNHFWMAQIYKRTEGRGLCPDCNPRSRPQSHDKNGILSPLNHTGQ